MSLLEIPSADVPLVPTPIAVDPMLVAPVNQALAPAPVEIDRRSIYISSMVATTVLFFLIVAIPCWIAFNPTWALGLGGMSAVWGGPGFGVMVGGARIALREEAAERH